MAGRRRMHSPEFRVQAARRVIDNHRRVAEVARELDLHENLLHRWVSEERRRIAAAEEPTVPDPGDGASVLAPDERAELVRLRAKVAEQAKDIEFLEKASAYFAGKRLR